MATPRSKLSKAIRKFQQPSAVESNGAKSRGPTTEAGRLGVWLNASKRGRFNLARWSWWSERHPRNGIDSAYGISYGHALRAPVVTPPRGKPSLLGAIGHLLFE